MRASKPIRRCSTTRRSCRATSSRSRGGRRSTTRRARARRITRVLPPKTRGERADAHKTRRVAAITAAGLSVLRFRRDGRRRPPRDRRRESLTAQQREALELLAGRTGRSAHRGPRGAGHRRRRRSRGSRSRAGQLAAGARRARPVRGVAVPGSAGRDADRRLTTRADQRALDAAHALAGDAASSAWRSARRHRQRKDRDLRAAGGGGARGADARC